MLRCTCDHSPFLTKPELMFFQHFFHQTALVCFSSKQDKTSDNLQMLLDLMLLDRANQMQWHFELQHCLAHTELCVTIFYLKIGNFLTGVQPRIFHDRKEGISRSRSSRTPKIASSLRQEKMPVFSSRHFFRFSKNDRKLQLEYTTILLVMCHC